MVRASALKTREARALAVAKDAEGQFSFGGGATDMFGPQDLYINGIGIHQRSCWDNKKHISPN